MNTTQTRIQRISYETSECIRCGGEGRIDAFAGIHGGVCFGCNGSGHVFTPKGRAAYKKAQAWLTEHNSVPVTDLVAGDRIYVQNMRGAQVAVTVRSCIQEDNGTAYIIDGQRVAPLHLTTVDSKGNETSRGHQPDSTQTYRRVTSQDDLQALALVLARMSGAIITYAQEA